MKINLTNRNTVGTVKLTTGSAPLAGAAGSQGSQGVQGTQGAQGFQGVQGSQGLPGTAVSKGDKGDQGFQGFQGFQGEQGVQGSQGLPGTAVGKGDKGDIGAQGAQGAPGSAGPQGSAGSKGDKGDVGPQGSPGGQGDAGLKGEKGDTGAQGIQGAKGDTGAQGVAGINGAQGAQGIAGVDGAQGAAGSKGDKGDVGVQGAQGIAGIDGAQGAAGAKGDVGVQGAQGLKGDKGDDVNSIAAFNQANSAYDQANAAYLQANSAYDDANTRVLKAGDTMTGNLNVAASIISQNIVPNLDVTYDLGTPTRRFRDLYLSGATLYLGNTVVSTSANDEIVIGSLNANTINLAGYNVQTWINDTTERANLKVETIEGELLSVSTSNTGNVVVANLAIRQANTTQTGVVQLSDDVNNTNVDLAATANTVNIAYSEATTARSEIYDLNILFTDLNTYVFNALTPTVNFAANTVRVSANGGSTLSKQQLNFTNTADVIVSVGAGAGAASGNANVGFTLGTTGVAAGTYGSASNVAAITVDSKGRITSVSNVTVIASEALATAAYNQANAAYEAANTKLPIAGGTITGDLTVSGNLAVLGDSTVLNVSVLKVEDNEIILNSNVTGAPTLNALLTVNRGANANVALRWNETTDKWEWTDDGVVYTAFSSIAGSGPQGAAGAQGATGAQGAAGSTGPQGAQGVQGAAGTNGSQGVQGAQGRQGATGTIGEQGFQGVQGATGSQGIQGAIGPQGLTGAQGIQGATGSQGVQGATGAQGIAGANTIPIQVANTTIGERRTLDFRSANTSNLTISGTDDPTNNKVILVFDNPKLGGGGGVSAYGNTELYISDNQPISANSNTALWWRANTGKFYIYYNDGDSAQWVSLTPSPIVNTSSNLFFSDANTAASIGAANTLYQEKADRAGDIFTGNVSVVQSGTKLNISSAIIESNNRLTINASEYKVNNITISANSSSTTDPAQTIIDIVPTSSYRTVKYLIQVKNGGSYHATEILVLHDGTSAYMTEYGTVTSGPSLGEFSTVVTGGNLQLIFDPVYAVNTLNISRICLPA